MRRSPIRELLAQRKATFGELAGIEVPLSFSSLEEEYAAVRGAVGLSDFSFTTRYRVPEDGFEVLERYAAGSVANIRFGRVLHTLAADAEGRVTDDLFIANDDERLFLIGETIVGDEATARTLDELGAAGFGAKSVADETALFGVDGFKAFAVVRDLFGSDVLGLPYLSLETYKLDEVEVKLVRAGKTSEFGYLLLVPAEAAEAVWLRLEQAGAAYGMKLVGFDAHRTLRLDGRFFNIHDEGAAVRDPLSLGLQWMIDFGGADFCGKQAILDRRAAGLRKKIVGVVPGDPDGALAAGDAIRSGGEQVAGVVTARFSPTLGRRMGLALFDKPYAYSGLDFAGDDGRAIRTISLPPFTAKSLTVKLDEQ